MSEPSPDCSSTLKPYTVTEREFLKQNAEYDLLCTGVVVFNRDGKLLLVQRAADEKAFPNYWEIPGGKVDDSDETILHGACRELEEETGLKATRVVRKVTQFSFSNDRPGGATKTWLKLVFEIEVENMENIKLDPAEHQNFLFASEEEINKDTVGDIQLAYISPQSKVVKLTAFELRREATA